jgi:hypothetical protein
MVGLIIGELERKAHGLIKLLSQHLPGGTEKNNEKPQ